MLSLSFQGLSLQSVELAYARLAFKYGIRERRRLWLKLSKLIDAGVPILQAIQSLYDRRIKSGSKQDPMSLALQLMVSGMQNGERLGNVLTGWVPDAERMLIASGEQAGETARALILAAETMESKQRIRNAVLGGISYPIVLFIMALAVMYLFGFKIVPGFTQVVNESQFHGMAKAMIVVSKFVQIWLGWFVVGVLGLAAIFLASLSRWNGLMRERFDRFPPYSIYRIVVGSNWLIALSSLIEAGLRIESALSQMLEGASPWLSDRINNALLGMRSGLTLGDSLDKAGQGFPDQEIVEDLGVFSGLSEFDEQLARMGKEWMTQAVEEIQWRMRIVFGFAIMFIGSVVAFMVSGMMTMQLQMAQALQAGLR